MNTRRNLLIALGAALFTPGAVFAQAKKPPVLIGYLSFSTRELGAPGFAAFKEGLAALGWKEGAQIVIEARWADGQDDRLASYAQEFAAKKTALIVASPLRAVVIAAKGAPKIPIVMVSNLDPVAAGVVTSLARPGGMITGLAGFSVEIAGKYLEFLIAAAPKVKRVGFLASSNNPNLTGLLDVARRSAMHRAVEARFAEVIRPEEIEPAILRLAKEGAQGLVVLTGALVVTERRRILELALAQRWPVVGGGRAWAEDGALLSYSSEEGTNFRRAAWYVDRILKGAKPGDLPIEQPTTFEMVVNLKTAKALGLTMSPEIMVQATQVIQ